MASRRRTNPGKTPGDPREALTGIACSGEPRDGRTPWEGGSTGGRRGREGSSTSPGTDTGPNRELFPCPRTGGGSPGSFFPRTRRLQLQGRPSAWEIRGTGQPREKGISFLPQPRKMRGTPREEPAPCLPGGRRQVRPLPRCQVERTISPPGTKAKYMLLRCRRKEEKSSEAAKCLPHVPSPQSRSSADCATSRRAFFQDIVRISSPIRGYLPPRMACRQDDRRQACAFSSP